MRLALFACAIFLAPAISEAQEANRQSNVIDRPFVIVGAALVGATVYDLESTFAVMKSCPADMRCFEANPIQRPFVNRDRLATYTFNLAIDGGMMYAAYQLKKSERFHKLWWFVPVGGIVGHAIGGTANIKMILSWK